MMSSFEFEMQARLRGFQMRGVQQWNAAMQPFGKPASWAFVFTCGGLFGLKEHEHWLYIIDDRIEADILNKLGTELAACPFRQRSL